MGDFDNLCNSLSKDSQRRGLQFELVCKWFLENDPTYQQLLRRVWLWKDWPGRKGIDAGIDLVAVDHDGKLWAIQAKAYGAAYSISKRDVDTFVAESSRATFTHRLLIGTTDKRHHLATRLMDDLGIPFLGLTRLRDADDYLDWPATPGALRPSKPPKPKKPWPYQQAAIKDVVKGFTTADRGQLLMACGTGKTLTAWFIREKLAAERTLVLVPSLSLLKQTMREWQTANPNVPFAALPVCSDETAGSLGEDAAVSHVSDLGVPVTTDPAVIAEFLRKRSGPRVVFSTYQSSPQVAKAFRKGRVPAFDLVIADEAHRVAGAVSSDFGTVLNLDAIKAKRRLFMTATPRYFTGRVLRAAKQADYEVASMDDHTKFGEVFHRLTFSQAIEDKLLTDYQVAIIGVDDATYRDWAETAALVTLGGKRNTDARSLAGQIGLAKAMRKFDLHRVISFHSRVKAAKEFAASMPAVLDWMPARQRPNGKLWADYVSGEMSAGDRHVLLQHLNRLDDGERGLLANARCLSEGVDVPALDGVAFIDPRRSEVDIVQAVGRAIRKSNTKDIGTIVIPVFIDTNEDAEVALDSSVFKPVWDVIKALRAHDTELGEQLDELRREMGRKEVKPKLPGKIHVDVPATLSKDFAAAFEAHLVDATTAPWEFWFGLLQKYASDHQHMRVPLGTDGETARLARWIARQRTLYDESKLSAERQHKLEALQGWTWDPFADRWEENYNALLRYTARHGAKPVPQKCVFDGFALGTWVTLQRTKYTKGTLDADRQHRLESVPGWSWDPKTDQWIEGYRRLNEYVMRGGSPRIPAAKKIEGFPLGQWISVQRGAHARNSMRPDRQQQLEAIPGWSWSARDDKWDERFYQLQDFVSRHGNARVPDDYTVDGQPLGTWVGVQRSLQAKGKLDAARAQRLAGLPGWEWDPISAQWEEGFSHLQSYVETYGDARVAFDQNADGYPLGRWVARQRASHRGGALDAERVARLEGLTGWTWAAREDRWEHGFQKLCDYVTHQGNAGVEADCNVDGFDLGRWVLKQRTRYGKGLLELERATLLGNLPGWSWDPHAEKWEAGFRHLQSYTEQNGGASVPTSYRADGGYPLGLWAARQRRRYKLGKLEPERRRRLESLTDWTCKPPRGPTARSPRG